MSNVTIARSKPDELHFPDLLIQADISTPNGVEKVIKEVFARLDGVDILINNVGGSSAPTGGALALSDEDWQHTFNANLFAAVRLDRAFLPHMLEQGAGVIIHISSIPAYPTALCNFTLSGGKGGIDELQQRTLQGSCTKRRAGKYRCSRFHRNVSYQNKN